MVVLKSMLLWALAVSILSCLSLAAAPPAFPWESTGISVSLAEVPSGFPIGDSNAGVTISYAGGTAQAAIHTDASGTATLYPALPSGVQSISATFEVHGANGTPSYLSQPTTLTINSSGPQRVAMVPVGIASGVITSANGSGVPAEITFSCENSALQPPPMAANADGTFHAVLPQGECQAEASLGNEYGSVQLAIEKGTESGASIQLTRKPPLIEEISSSPNRLFIAFIVVLSIAAIAAFIAYFYLGKKGGKGKRAAMLLALPLTLLLLPALASAATASIGTTNITHTYDLRAHLGYVPDARQAIVTVATDSIDGCSGRTIVEIGDDGENYAQVASLTTTSPQPYTINLTSPGSHRYYRIRNGDCWLKSSSIEFRERPDLSPTALAVASTSGSPEPQNGVPARLTATVSNLGGALDRAYVQSVTVYFYADSVDDAHKIGQVILGSSSAIWNERQSTTAETIWAPPSIGPRTLYARVEVIPQDAEADPSNNQVSKGIFVEPAPSEQRATNATLSSSPQSAVGSLSAGPTLRMSYSDALTRQPVLGANCTLTSPDLLAAPANMAQNDTGYVFMLRNSSAGVGVYEFDTTCTKPGYAPAAASYFLPVNSPGGQAYQTINLDGTPRLEMILKRASLGSMQRLKIRFERMGPESVGLGRDAVRINSFTASAVASDAQERGGYYWLEHGSTYVEWTFDMGQISGETLTISATPVLDANGTPVQGASLYIIPTLVQAICTHRSAEMQVSPATQTGEVGTPLYYHVTVASKDDPECDSTVYEISLHDGREGWSYTLSSSHVPVSPGHSNITFLSVTPPVGEQPGSYKFQLRAFPVSTGPVPAVESFADAYYDVSSPKLFTGLEAGADGNGTFTALPGASVRFSARYHDIGNSTIGSCRFVSELSGAQGVQMQRAGSVFELAQDISDKPPGQYFYVIACSAEGYRPQAFAGNVTLIAPPTPYRIPSATAFPAAQVISAGHSASYLLTIHNNAQCSGAQDFILSAEPPAGWSAAFEKDYLSIPCGSSRTTSVTINTPEGAQPGVSLIPVAAAAAGAPQFSKRILLSAGIAPGFAEARSCLAGDATESPANFASAGDYCWNWNSEHTYYMGTGAGGALYISGQAATLPCTSAVYLEGSNDSSTFTGLAQMQPEASGGFVLSTSISGYSFVRVRSSCLLKVTSLLFTLPKPVQPDLFLVGASFPGELRAGEPATAVIVVRNAGPSIYSQYSSMVGLRSPDGVITPLNLSTTYSHAAGQDIEARLAFTPPSPGQYDLIFTADYSSDINESDESNNLFVVKGVEVLPAQASPFAARLYPGWNAVPFIYGAAVTTNCTGEALFRISPSRSAKLDPQTLHFTSAVDASDFVGTHGTAAEPRTGLALGGAWYYADTACEISYSLTPGMLSSRLAESQLEVPAGGAMLAVLPWMPENTLGNMMGSCAPRQLFTWDAVTQHWAEAGSAITPEMVGSVVVVNSATACRLG